MVCSIDRWSGVEGVCDGFSSRIFPDDPIRAGGWAGGPGWLSRGGHGRPRGGSISGRRLRGLCSRFVVILV